MKLKRVGISNLASLEKADIDFERAPLADAVLFLICGPTGAGKSTIFDAVCLALYGEVPRMKGWRKSAAEGMALAPDDVLQLVRKGAAKSFAKVVFEADNGEEYTAVWAVRRKRAQKNQKNPWAIEVSLLDAQGNPLGNNKTEVYHNIRELVGLDFSQFRRMILLAQGDFTGFLKSEDKDKGRILEKITNLTVYGRIGHSIAERTAGQQRVVETIQLQLDNRTPLSDVQREEINARLAELSQKRAGALSRKTQAAAGKALHETAASAAKARDKVKKDIDDLNTLIISPQWVADSDLVRRYDACATAREAIAEKNGAARTISDNRTAIDALRHSYAVFAGMRLTAEKALATAKADLAAKEAMEATHAAARRALPREKDISDLLHGIKSGYESYLTQLKAAELKERTLTPEEKNGEPADTRKLKTDAENADTSAQLAALVLSLKQLKETKALLEDKLATSEAALEKHRTDLETERRKLDFLTATTAAYTERLRAMLTPGCECPVCRQTVKAVPEATDAATRQLLEAQKKEIEHLEADAEKAAKLVNVWKVKSGLNAERIKQVREALAGSEIPADWQQADAKAMETVEEDLRLKAEAAKAAYDRAIRTNDAKVAASTLRTQAQTSLSNAKTAITQLNEFEEATQWRPAQAADASGCLENFDKAMKALRSFDSALAKARSDADAARNRCNEYSGQNDSILEALPEWKDTPPEEGKLSRQQILDLVTRTSSLGKQKADAETTVEAANQTVRQFLESQEEITAELLEALAGTDPADIERKRAAMHESTGRLKTLLEQQTETEDKAAAAEQVCRELPAPEELERRIQDAENEIASIDTETGAERQRLADDDRLRAGREELVKRLRDETHLLERWKKLHALFGVNDGARFREVAQKCIFGSLLAAASTYLQRLTGGRYTLHSVPDSFVIEISDAWQGGQRRSVNTVSGGESFMVSLALALGLSEMGPQARSNILLIDEGFGSLSDTPLRQAVALLRNLHHSAGRRVGVISHMEALRGEIPVQLRLTPNPTTGTTDLLLTVTD